MSPSSSQPVLNPRPTAPEPPLALAGCTYLLVSFFVPWLGLIYGAIFISSLGREMRDFGYRIVYISLA